MFDPDQITMAFQPIVDINEGGKPCAYEALVRGVNGEPASTIMSRISVGDEFEFDAYCRSLAVQMAQSLGLDCQLSVNVSPGAFCSPQFGIHSTIRTARNVGFPCDRLIFEVTEHEPFLDLTRLCRLFAACRSRGIKIALDDFGSGYAGLNTLLLLKPDIVKLDIGIISRIDGDENKQALVRGIMITCESIGITVVAEGVETEAEVDALRSLGVRFLQGFLFARPIPGALPVPKRWSPPGPSRLPRHSSRVQEPRSPVT